MKRILQLSVMFLAAALCGSAWAATPVAVWDGFTGTEGDLTKNGYTWTKSTNTTIANGVVIIGSDGGLTLTLGNSDIIRSNKMFTIIMDVSDIPSTDYVAILDATVGNNHVALTCTDTTLNQRWNTTANYGSLSNFSRDSTHRIAFTYLGNGNNNEVSGSTTYIDGVRSIHAGNLQTSTAGVGLINIGAYNNNASNVAAGMKIHNLALFDYKLSDWEVRSFDMAMPTMISNVDKGLSGESSAADYLTKLRMIPQEGLTEGTNVRIKSIAIGKRSDSGNIPNYLVLNGIKSGTAVGTTVNGVAMSRWDFGGEVVLTMGEEYSLKGYDAGGNEIKCGFGLYTNCSNNDYKAVWCNWLNAGQVGVNYAPRYAIEVEVADSPMPILWTKFDGNFDSFGSKTIAWSDTGVSYEASLNGKAAYTGNTDKYPYLNSTMDWGSATSFSMIGSFKVGFGDSQTDPSGLCGFGWKDDGFMLAANVDTIGLVWMGSHVTGTSPIMSETLPMNLTAGYHSYALVADASSSTVKVYVDGEEVISRDETTISLVSSNWNNNNQKRGGILSLPGGTMSGTVRNTATCCDDYRVYGVALTPAQVMAVAKEQLNNPAASINGTFYATIDDALNAAQANDTVTILASGTASQSLSKALTIVVKSGVMLKAGNANAFGANGSSVTVENGGAIDLNGKNGLYNFTIAGSGIDGAGAIVNEASGIGSFASAGAKSLTLTDDATVGGSYWWGMWNDNSAALTLNDHTMTIKTHDSNASYGFVFGKYAVPTGTGKISLASEGKLWLYSNAAHNFGALDIEIQPNSTVIYGGPITGTGTITLDCTGLSNVPVVSLANGWTGTVWIKNFNFVNTVPARTSGNRSGWFFEEYGNANSKVKLTGITGYPPNAGTTCAAEVVLADDGSKKAIEMTAGYSSQTYTFAKLSGSGTLGDNNNSAQHTLIIKDASGFTGTIDTHKKKLVIGANAASMPATSGVVAFAGATVDTTVGAMTIKPTISVDSVTIKVAALPTIEAPITVFKTPSSTIPEGGMIQGEVTVKIGDEVQAGNFILESKGTSVVVRPLGDGEAARYTISGYKSMGGIVADREVIIDGTGGVQTPSLTMAANGVLKLDPIKTPVYVTSTTAPTFAAGAKIALAEKYADFTKGVFTLLTWDGDTTSTTVIPEGLFDTTSAKGADVKVYLESYTTRVDNNTNGETKTYTALKVDLDQSYEKPALTVMPLGDSITEGSNPDGVANPNYRVILMAKLAAEGYNVKSTGFRKIKNWNQAGIYQPEEWSWHNGVSGQLLDSSNSRAGWRDALEATLDASDIPDIITFKIGTNDQQASRDIPKTFNEWVAVIKRIIAARPSTKIVVGSIMPFSNGSTWGSGETSWNARLKYACEHPSEYDIPEGYLFFAPLADNCPRTNADGTSNFVDGLHPNWRGHETNAETWLGAIKTAMKAPIPGTYKPNEKVGAKANVQAEYLSGFAHIATYQPKNKAYSYTSPAESTMEYSSVGYYMELKNTRSGNVRWIWVDMDNWNTDKTFAKIGLPVTQSYIGEVANLHIDTNDGGIEKIGPTDNTRTGWVQFTPNGMNKNASASGAPSNFFVYDWNDAENNSAYGVMNVYLKDPTYIDNGVEVCRYGAQTLMAYSRWNEAKQQIGIGNCAIHGAPLVYGNIDTTVNYMETYQYERLNLDSYELANIEIWGKPVDAEAKIGDTYFKTLQDAVTAAENGDTVELVNDVEVTGLEISGKAVILEHNGKITDVDPLKGTSIGPAINSECTVKLGNWANAVVIGDLKSCVALTANDVDEDGNAILNKGAIYTKYRFGSGFITYFVGKSITLDSDMTLPVYNRTSGSIAFCGKNGEENALTLELNGYTLLQPLSDNGHGFTGLAAVAVNSGYLAIQDTSEAGTGKIIGCTNTLIAWDYFDTEEGLEPSHLTLKSGTISSLGGWTGSNRGSVVTVYSDFVMEGGTIVYETANENCSLMSMVYALGSSCVINGGTIGIPGDDYKRCNYALLGYHKTEVNGGNIGYTGFFKTPTLNGGTFFEGVFADCDLTVSSDSKASIGYLQVKDGRTIILNGGTYGRSKVTRFDASYEVMTPAELTDYLAAGYAVVMNENGLYAPLPKTPDLEITISEDGKTITPSVTSEGSVIVVNQETLEETEELPQKTGLYGVIVKNVAGKSTGTSLIGVVASKAVTSEKTVNAVAVPFKGKTVATLLNTALLNEGDVLMAWINGDYEVWTLHEDKTWKQQPITRAGGESSEGIDPTTATLKCGQAVWVTTAGKIVTFGDTAAEGETVAVEKGHNLLGNPGMTAYTPAATTQGDQIVLMDNQRCTAVQSGETTTWITMQADENDPTLVTPTVVTPEVGVGQGFWFIKK